jgi:1,4-alpha-glucan branching enzyme
MTHEFEALLRGESAEPHVFLGAHPAPGGIVIRAFSPYALRATAVFSSGQRVGMRRTNPRGLFEASLPGATFPVSYSFEFENESASWTSGDPYRFLPTLDREELARFGAASHRALWNLLGAHVRTVEGESGVSFSVWAPNARSVSVIGDFNGWNRLLHPMRSMGSSGVWELFIPGMGAGERYKFSVLGADGVVRDKADPYGRQFEVRPASATIVEQPQHRWGDGQWMARRARHDWYHEPMSIYELHLGSWRRHDDGTWLNYRELAAELAPYLVRMGYTHVELLPVCEHPYDGSWGYQVTGFFAPTSRFGTPDDFRAFVDTLHQANIGVMVDWVPAHFATDDYGLSRFDGTALYEHEDMRRRYQPDWGTYAFNYARNEVRNFLIASALFWVKEFHIDGLRVDAVSSMVYLDYSRNDGEWEPNIFGGREHLEAVELLKYFNEYVYAEGEGAITVAEESTAWPAVSRPTFVGGLGFGFKWNMGWMHDTLVYFSNDPIYRRYHQGMLTFSMVYAYTENYVLSLSHDEVVHGKSSLLHKMPGDEWQQFANLRLLYAYQYAFPGKKLLFMGSEFGQRSEWNHDAAVEWQALLYPPHRQLQDFVAALNETYRSFPALYLLDHEPAGFSWLDYNDADNSVISFVRRDGDEQHDVVCVFNFTPMLRADYRIPVPGPGPYRELFNSDATEWGGSNVRNVGALRPEPEPYVGRDYSLRLTLPPLGAVFLTVDSA